jgi:hypothetical protein
MTTHPREIAKEMPWFGRIRMVDPNDKKYLMKPDKEKAEQVTAKTWAYGTKVLNQGPTSQCVGYSTWEYLYTSPVRNKPKLTPTQIYRKAQEYDQYPGEDYEGSSIRGAFKYLQKEAQLLESYEWAFDCETAIAHLLTEGPVLVGTNWYNGMDEADKHGYIWATGGGGDMGHAYLIIGANRERKNPDGTRGAVRMLNSWGEWGEKGSGRAWITFQCFDFLIKEDGEAGIGKEILGVQGTPAN